MPHTLLELATRETAKHIHQYARLLTSQGCRLSRIYIRESTIDDRAIAVLSGVFPHLRQLAFLACDFTPLRAKTLNSLASSCGQLRALSLIDCKGLTTTMSTFLDAIAPNLTTLTLVGLNSSAEDIISKLPLRKLRFLAVEESLHLPLNALLSLLTTIAKNCQGLVGLSLRSTLLSCQDGELFWGQFRNFRLPNLKILDLRGCWMPSSSLEELSQILGQCTPQLVRLDLQNAHRIDKYAPTYYFNDRLQKLYLLLMPDGSIWRRERIDCKNGQLSRVNSCYRDDSSTRNPFRTKWDPLPWIDQSSGSPIKYIKQPRQDRPSG